MRVNETSDYMVGSLSFSRQEEKGAGGMSLCRDLTDFLRPQRTSCATCLGRRGARMSLIPDNRMAE